MGSRLDSQTAGATAASQQTRSERRAERARAHKAKMLSLEIEKASGKRRSARLKGDAKAAHELDRELLGPDRGEGPNSRVGRGRDRAGAFDPYNSLPDRGLFAELRREGGPLSGHRGADVQQARTGTDIVAFAATLAEQIRSAGGER
jgi:hypothetical protein